MLQFRIVLPYHEMAKEGHLIWLPRTLMLSKGCADCPLRMSFTFFRCVFMAMSTPAGENTSPHTLCMFVSLCICVPPA